MTVPGPQKDVPRVDSLYTSHELFRFSYELKFSMNLIRSGTMTTWETGHKGFMRSWLRYCVKVSGELYSPAHFTHRDRIPYVHWAEHWGSLRAGLDARIKTRKDLDGAENLNPHSWVEPVAFFLHIPWHCDMLPVQNDLLLCGPLYNVIDLSLFAGYHRTARSFAM